MDEANTMNGPAPSGRATSDIRFLVVDDQEFSRHILGRQLNGLGHDDIDFAADGREALELIQRNDYQLVFLDINMPELDGVEVLKRMKSDMKLRDTPVIVVSSDDQSETVARCIELGAEDHLGKPFDPNVLKARVAAALVHQRLQEAERAFVQRLKSEKQKSERLLEVILPVAAARELRVDGAVRPRRFEDVAVLFCDLVGFTDFCDDNSPEEVVGYLQRLFERFEEITETHRMEKIKTIGDAYMATSGLLRNNAEPMLAAVKAGLEMGAAVPEVVPGFSVRVGVHVGPVVAGIVGRQKYQYDLWGDTVNVAARLASVGTPGVVTLTEGSWLHVEEHCRGRSRGSAQLKGKGSVDLVECTGLR